MKKKEIEKALQNPPKPDYLYNRYDGRINKLLKIAERKYIDVKTGVITDLNKYALFGKVTYDIIDLIEVGDLIEIIGDVETDNGMGKIDKVLKVDDKRIYCTSMSLGREDIFKNYDVSILTHEQYKQNCFRVEG